MELTVNEKRLLATLGRCGSADSETLANELSADAGAVVQWAHLAAGRGLVSIRREVHEELCLTDEGRLYAEQGLPERQVVESIDGTIPMSELSRHPLSKVAIGWMRKNNWIKIESGIAKVADATPKSRDEDALAKIAAGAGDLKDCGELKSRGLVTVHEEVCWIIGITPGGRKILEEGIDLRPEVGTLTREQILSGSWRNDALRRYSLTTPPRRMYPGKAHPYRRILDEVRTLLLEMGFSEFSGNIVQSVFWNFDALFQPQDHPAREMQDTFYLDRTHPLPDGWEKIRDMHEHGGDTSSTGWGGVWDKRKAEGSVLRTHSTALSIQYIAAHPKPPVKAFSLSRVYRRESIDPTHLAEFEQLEGIVMDEGVTFNHLLGFLKEFYFRMGFSDVRFRPGYFPYTEPSVEPEVWVDGLGWVELGGAGIFREEVTSSFGINYPVLAWGLGISRVAMLRLGLKDLRQLYKSDIDWVRNHPSYRRD
ncbi:phenylalanine--tRNA ligase subunit alpha [Methanocalculus sp.]|uniref:phenylalanine--tRNA ligase subunit alpha n=1 Tax=Methanocalculus sp. TaxID=2004547 RepID=UPI002727B7E1|nr:phenylalanine--tRNA ligase subunit alpha [Methanocalculus sp.]MDO8840754.1 phenylalanine--tRNA ligase subunit alpha [Methanocalculus sp.]